MKAPKPTSLGQAVASLESAVTRANTLEALRAWRIAMAKRIIRPASSPAVKAVKR